MSAISQNWRNQFKLLPFPIDYRCDGPVINEVVDEPNWVVSVYAARSHFPDE